MRIGIDIMGGDHGPQITTRGALLALEELPEEVRLVLIGDQPSIEEVLASNGFDRSRVDIVPSKDDITMHDNPTKALQAKPGSSIAKGFAMLQKGDIDAFASTGNTGAMLVGSMFTVKAIEGVARPCITTMVPKENGTYGLMLDVGSNADVKPETLCQFGVLGSLLAKHVYHMESPKVGLMSIGEEEKKGNLVTQAAHQLLKQTPNINFIGNVEGRDLFNDKADVIVCDGFTGNIVLKVVEAFHSLLMKRGVHDEFFDRFNYENYGGTPILGINGTVIIGHGISNDVTIKNMIVLTKEVADSKLSDRIREAFK